MIKIKNNSRIVFLGDSITDVKFNSRMNYKLHGRKVYAVQLAKKLKKQNKTLKFFYKGIASDRTYLVYDRLTKDCISLKPDIVIMLIGVNDAWENYVPEQYPPLKRPMEVHMQEIYRRLRAELDNVQILYLMPFMIDAVEEKKPFHKVLDKFRESLKKMALDNGADIIDLQAVFNEEQKKTAPKLLATDGIHPTNEGHRVIADAIMKNIEFE